MSERPSPAPEELHWGISYLREDIQDLRSQMREDTQETRQEMRHQIGAVHQRIDETNKRIDIHFRWIMTTLIAVTGVLIAVIKL